MKKTMKSLMAMLLMAASALACQAAVNLAAMTTGTPLPHSGAKQLLGSVMLHNPDILTQCEVTMDTLQRLPSGARVILCTLEKKGSKFAVEHYAVTLDPRGFVADGALMWKEGDSNHLTIDTKTRNSEVDYVPSMKVTYAIKGDTIETVRHYRFFTNTLGGNYFEKNGQVFFRLVADSEGKLTQLQPEAVARMEKGDANYLSPDHKQPTYSTVKGEADPMGIQVLMLMSMPASTLRDKKAIAKLNDEANEMIKIFDKAETIDRRTIFGNNIFSYENWCASVVLRSAYYTLPWIVQNEKTEHFSRYLIPYVKDKEVEHEWLDNAVSALKEKKLRKWWKKWIEVTDDIPHINLED